MSTSDLQRQIGKVFVLLDLERFDEAAQLASELLASEPQNSDLLTVLGYCNLVEGKVRKADKIIRSALAANPENEWAHRILGQIFLSCNRTKKALEHYNKAIELSPWHPEPYLARSGVYIHLADHRVSTEILGRTNKNFEAALSDLRQAKNLNPNNSAAHVLEAKVWMKYHKRGVDSKAKAKQAVLKALEIDPQNSEAHELLGQIAEKEGKITEATDHYLEAGLASPTDARYLSLLQSPLSKRLTAIWGIAIYLGILFFLAEFWIGITLLVVVAIACSLYASNQVKSKYSHRVRQVIEADQELSRSRTKLFFLGVVVCLAALVPLGWAIYEDSDANRSLVETPCFSYLASIASTHEVDEANCSVRTLVEDSELAPVLVSPVFDLDDESDFGKPISEVLIQRGLVPVQIDVDGMAATRYNGDVAVVIVDVTSLDIRIDEKLVEGFFIQSAIPGSDARNELNEILSRWRWKTSN